MIHYCNLLFIVKIEAIGINGTYSSVYVIVDQDKKYQKMLLIKVIFIIKSKLVQIKATFNFIRSNRIDFAEFDPDSFVVVLITID